MHLGGHNNALLEIYHIFNTFKSLTKHDIFELNILKVNCLRYKKYYNEALSINKSMLASLDKDDKENSISVISNILNIENPPIFIPLPAVTKVNAVTKTIITIINNFFMANHLLSLL